MTDEGDQIDPVAMAGALGKLAEQDFSAFESDLRCILRDVPREKRDSLVLPDEVWKQLYGPVFMEGVDKLKHDDAPPDTDLSPDDEQVADETMWQIVCGLVTVVGEK
jgi:hypothetical protein